MPLLWEAYPADGHLQLPRAVGNIRSSPSWAGSAYLSRLCSVLLLFFELLAGNAGKCADSQLAEPTKQNALHGLSIAQGYKAQEDSEETRRASSNVMALVSYHRKKFFRISDFYATFGPLKTGYIMRGEVFLPRIIRLVNHADISTAQ